MSETLAEWIIVWTFCLLIIGLTFTEAIWLKKQGGADFGKAFAFSAVTNFIGIGIGFFVVFVVLAIFMMLAFDGSLQKAPLGDTGLIIVLILTALFTPALLTICKRLFLKILKIQINKSAWLYSLVISVLILVVSLGIPVLIGYLFYR